MASCGRGNWRMVKQGDIIWLDFDPQTGHEQSGRRPALVISNNVFHWHSTTMAMVCPITKTKHKFAYRISLGETTQIQGHVMCDQAKILDLSSRNPQFIESAPSSILKEAVDIVFGIIYIGENEQ